MNFLSNVLNSIPVVGHVKGGIHYLAGDEEGGHQAIYQSTRTSAVMVGGTAGLVLGPAGAAVGAVYGGLATDLVASGLSGKAQGIVGNCESVGKDIASGRNPIGSIASTGFQIALDSAGGLGMGGVSNAAAQISEKAVANSIQNVGKKVVSVVGEEVLEKTFQVSAKEVTKAIGKKASERVVRQVIQQTAMAAEVVLVTTHVAKTAQKQTEEDEEKERREREREWREERERRERERREREERERREREERERREREERERREREEQERREREEQERRERERERLAREARERHEREERVRREREERERQVNEERERCDRLEREQRAIQEREEALRRERERQSANQNGTSQKHQPSNNNNNTARATTVTNQQPTGQSTSSGSSSGAPQGNKNNNNNNNNNNKKTKKKWKTDKEILDEYMQLLKKMLHNIYGTAKEPISGIFSKTKLAKHGSSLVKILRTIKNFDLLEAVLDTVIKMFKDHMSKDICFENFLSLLEFARSYLNDKIDKIQTETTEYEEGTYDERRVLILRDIRTEPNLIQDIVALFERLADEIRTECAPPNNISPDFRNMFAKVYHYYKHMRIPELPDYEQKNIQVPEDVRANLPEDNTFSVRQYFYWVRTLLERLKNHPRYVAEVLNQPPPITCRYEIYMELFGYRFRVVVKVRRGPQNIPVFVTSTVFLDDGDYDGDEENGFEDMDIQPK